jgi:hypothetical protein
MAGNKRARTDIRKGLPPEPDLQEHQRLINRALRQNAARHLARSAQNAGAPTWGVLVSVGVLFIAAVAALLVASMVFPQ